MSGGINLFNKIYKLLKYFQLNSLNNYIHSPNISDTSKKNIPKSIVNIKKHLENVFSDCHDFVFRELTLGQNNEIKIAIAFIDGLVDKQILNRDILKPLMINSQDFNIHSFNNSLPDILKDNILNNYNIKKVDSLDDTISFILSGESIIYIDGEKYALIAETSNYEIRNVDEPDTEAVVRGPREGFVESLKVNISLIRRKIKNPKLKVEKITLGKQTNTDVCICYINGIVHQHVVETVKKRLSKINIDAILESGYIEEFIEDSPLSIFPTVGNSEKPDIVAAKVLEGRVAILCDGTPFVLTVPYLFVETMQVSEDYYSRSIFTSAVRLLRVLSLFISTSLPAYYVALIAFHPSVIPFKLLLTISASREGIPFSPFTEALVMGIAFELLREAGVRMPRPIGQAVSIVGALVLGDAAVKAGLASTPMVIVTSITAITSFILPPLGGALPLIRLMLLLGANILGLLGILLVSIVIFIHACSLYSFGVPYMSPLAPICGADLKDTFVRLPLWLMFTRPKSLIKDNTNNINFVRKDDQYDNEK